MKVILINDINIKYIFNDLKCHLNVSRVYNICLINVFSQMKNIYKEKVNPFPIL